MAVTTTDIPVKPGTGSLLSGHSPPPPPPPGAVEAIKRLGQADTKNVQEIAASQLDLLTAYYRSALGQSDRSFNWALIGSAVGLLLFAVAFGFAVLNGLTLATVLPGTVFEALAGIVFLLYGKTSSQLSAFRSGLEVLQRHLLANSICESLSTAEERDKARAALIAEISRPQPDHG